MNKTKLIILAIAFATLSGCSLFSQRVTTEVVTVRVPVVYAPKPPVTVRPELVIQNLTDAQKDDPGTVAKYYLATITQLLSYAEELESVIKNYEVIYETLEANENQIDIDTIEINPN